MNIVIGIAILLTLMLSDQSLAPGDINIAFRLCGLVLLTVAAPFSATLMVFLNERTPSSERSFQKEVATARLNSSIHTVIWLISSLAIVVALGWQDVVRDAMQLGHWILIDEALIVAPMLCSLIVSWAIFFEQTSHDIPPERRFTEMKNYVGLRCRVYLLMVLIPIAIVVLIKDLWPLLSQLSPAFAGLVAVSAIIAMLLVMPLLVRLMWTNRPITEIEGRESLLQLCKNHGLAVKDIHVWDTNHQIVNALVAGLVPRFRILMVSDLLLHSFPQHELQAILRHEAGHIRLRHLQTRIGFILLPALAMLAIEMDPNQTFNNWAADFGITTSAGLLLGLVFFAYVIIVTTWLSRNMEFEADLYAIGAFQKNNSEIQTAQNASVMADALLRFAEQNPDQFSRRSITHPSLMERIEMIKKANNSTKVARDFQRRFGFCQFAIAFSILLVLVVLLAL